MRSSAQLVDVGFVQGIGRTKNGERRSSGCFFPPFGGNLDFFERLAAARYRRRCRPRISARAGSRGDAKAAQNGAAMKVSRQWVRKISDIRSLLGIGSSRKARPFVKITMPRTRRIILLTAHGKLSKVIVRTRSSMKAFTQASVQGSR